MFHPFVDDTSYYTYRRSLNSVEGFVIRSMHDEFMHSPSIIPVLHSLKSKEATLELYTYFIECRGAPEHDLLMDMKHKLCVALLHAGENSERKVGCPTDQALLGRSLLPNSEWRKASRVRDAVNTDIWTMRSVTGNDCRLLLQGAKGYIPLSHCDTSVKTRSLDEADYPQKPMEILESDSDESDGESDDEVDSERPGLDDDSEPVNTLEPSEILEVEVQNLVQRISNMLDSQPEPKADIRSQGVSDKEYVESLPHFLRYVLPSD